MVNSESEQIREVYARYGLAMYQAQCLERGLAIVIATLNPERMTAWDYDAPLAENFQSTFGQMVERFVELAGSNHPELVRKLRTAVVKRNKLTHHYFWERAVEFCSFEGREDMVRELAGMADRFDNLDDQLSELTTQFRQTRGITDEVVNTHLEKLVAAIEPPHNPERVPNQVVLAAAYEWRTSSGEVKSNLILGSHGGRHLVLGERGLCLGPRDIPADELFLKADFAAALPASVNPRPKKANAWNYTIPLANGYGLRIQPSEPSGKALCRFRLNRPAKQIKK
jgi:hypothetical protein